MLWMLIYNISSYCVNSYQSIRINDFDSHGTIEILCAILLLNLIPISRLTIMSREAKKKQAVRDEQVSYLHIAPL